MPSQSICPPAVKSTLDPVTVRASPPRYRCVAYMSPVGIRRVFWVNDAGQWQGGKVRDLMNARHGTTECTGDAGPIGTGLFVTKHEVLMLKRSIGEKLLVPQDTYRDFRTQSFLSSEQSGQVICDI